MKRFQGNIAKEVNSQTEKCEGVTPEMTFNRLATDALVMVMKESHRAKGAKAKLALLRIQQAMAKAVIAGCDSILPGPPSPKNGYLCVVVSPSQQKELRALALCYGMSLQVFIWWAIHHYARQVETSLGLTGESALKLTRNERRALGKKVLLTQSALGHHPCWAIEGS